MNEGLRVFLPKADQGQRRSLALFQKGELTYWLIRIKMNGVCYSKTDKGSPELGVNHRQ